MLTEHKETARAKAHVEGELSLSAALTTSEQTYAIEPGVSHRPVALVGGQAFSLGYITKARILYFFMGMAAVMFIAADVIAEFDGDPNTRTATNWVKQGRGHLAGLASIVAFLLWLTLHFLWDGFPL
jgi:hypothetical protein